MNPLIFWSQSHLAHTTNTSAMGALVIHVLLPDRTTTRKGGCAREGRLNDWAILFVFWNVLKPPDGSSVARVSMPEGSEPCPGSVSPKHPTMFPLANSGKNLDFCSSDPNASTAIGRRGQLGITDVFLEVT